MANFPLCNTLKIHRNMFNRNIICVDIICDDGFIFDFEWHNNEFSMREILAAVKILARTHQIRYTDIPAEFQDIYNTLI